MIPTALENLRLSFEKLEIPHDSVRLDATPRRLVLRAEGLPARQPDSEERVLGPAKSAPAPGRRRLRAQTGRRPGRPRNRIHRQGRILQPTPQERRGPRHHRYPRRSPPAADPRPHFPKTMYWTGKGGPRFIRPIRWIVALLGETDHPLRNCRRALRRADQRPPPPGRARFRRHVRRLRAAAARALRHPFRRRTPQPHPRGMAHPQYKSDDELLETLVYLTECPTPITGSFDPAVPRTARRSADHGDAAPPEVFLGGGCRRQTGAAFRRRHEHPMAIPKASSAAATSASCAPASTTPASSGTPIRRRSSPTACRISPTSPSRPSSAAIWRRPSA